MRRLIMSSVRPDSANVLRMIQENVSWTVSFRCVVKHKNESDLSAIGWHVAISIGILCTVPRTPTHSDSSIKTDNYYFRIFLFIDWMLRCRWFRWLYCVASTVAVNVPKFNNRKCILSWLRRRIDLAAGRQIRLGSWLGHDIGINSSEHSPHCVISVCDR